ncbi:MAG: hypothetical protein JSR60_03245 [Proteobacteria bacterium]|nr:hypothetical protein [Pseudomonadota bacterium]
MLLLRILDNLRRTRRPVYLELDAASRVRRLLLPRIVTVLGLDEIPSGDLAVRVEPSNLPHILRRSNPEFGVLRKALAKPGAVLLTETDAHEIVDVRPARKPASKAVSSRKRAKAASAVTMAQARTLFDLVATASCDPMTVPPPCIPFLYPDDGCWVRAHEMCRRIVAAGVEPAKIWLSGGLNVTTPNNPNCKLFWYYHVAPTVQVASSSGSEKLYVLDPSMFDEPVTDQVWMAAMNNPNAAVKRTPWTQYNLGGGEDPDFSQTEDGLIWLRDSLLLRSAGPDGPPPYAHCLTAAP